MATEIKLPSLGEGIESGDVLEVLVKAGDVVKKEQSLLEMETDKATVSVPSPVAGKIISVTVKEGATVKVGSVIATIEASGAAAPAPTAAPATPTPTPSPAAPAPAPVAPVVASKPAVAPAPKPTPPAPAPNPAPATAVATAAPPAAIPSTPAPSTADDSIAAGPAIRRFAREVGVDLANVQGSGEGGRITREDVLAVVRHANQSLQARSTTPAAPGLSPSASQKAASAKAGAESKPGVASQDDYGPIRVDRMSKIRKTIATQMSKSWSTAPRVVNFDDADVTELEAFRQTSKDDYASRGIKLTTMPFLIKAVATALRHHSTLNAVIDTENEQIIYKDYVNLGIAMDTERGLVVPVLKDADRMSIPDIAYSLSEMSSRVRNNDFSVSDLRGGTFTISNLGAIGGTYSTPIINVPEVAILLVGRSRKLPMVMDDDSIKPRLMMPLSIAYDHRLVDGATAARFLNDVIAYLEAPSRLLLAI